MEWIPWSKKRSYRIQEIRRTSFLLFFIYSTNVFSFLHNRSDLDLFTFKNFAH